MNYLPTKSSLRSEDSEILIDFGGYRRETLDCYIAIDDSCINIIEL